MFVACWSAKGGSGTTVVAAALALVLSRSSEEGALAVDLAGDLPAVLGLPEPGGPGLSDWFAAGTSVPFDALGRLEIGVTDGLGLVPRGSGALDPVRRVGALVELLAGDARSVVIDCGTLPPVVEPADAGAGDRGGRGGTAVGRAVAEAVPESLLVTRPCYLSLRRLVALPLRPTGIVLVTEAGRALGTGDVEQVVGVEVVAEVPIDVAVARAVDAGLLAGRLPPSLARALGRAR